MSTSTEERSLTLYEIEKELAEAAENASDEDLALVVAEYAKAAADKRDRVAGYLQHCKMLEDFADREMTRLRTRKASIERNRRRIESYVQQVMVELGVTRLEGKASEMRLNKCPPSVEITDAQAIPASYTVVTQECVVSKQKIGEALKAGIDVPGARLVTDKTRLVLL